jgi:hypothetical protein
VFNVLELLQAGAISFVHVKYFNIFVGVFIGATDTAKQ